jgi:hypothetical protein
MTGSWEKLVAEQAAYQGYPCAAIREYIIAVALLCFYDVKGTDPERYGFPHIGVALLL